MFMLNVLKALSDPTRLRLVAVLARGEFTVQELTTILTMGQSRISRHLKILSDAGILSVKRQGTWAYYRLEAKNGFFNEIWPALGSRLASLPESKKDLAGMAAILEDRRRRSQDFFDRHARDWDVLAGSILPVATYQNALLDQIPSCGVALELGLGTGILLSTLCQKASRVIGIDHSPAMLREAGERVRSENLKGVELRLGDMTHLPVGDGEIDAAVLNMVFHHAAQPVAVLDELHRVLRPAGVLIIADLQRHEREWARERMADQWLGFEFEELHHWLDSAGFSIKELKSVEGQSDALGVFVLKAEKTAVAGREDLNPDVSTAHIQPKGV